MLLILIVEVFLAPVEVAKSLEVVPDEQLPDTLRIEHGAGVDDLLDLAVIEYVRIPEYKLLIVLVKKC